MHVDYINVTVPETVSAAVIDEVTKILDYCGSKKRTPEVYTLGQTGTARIKKRNGYALVGISGDGIQTLRKHDMYASMLWAFAAWPHRVTSIDIAHDVPEETPPVLRRLWRRAIGPKGIRLTRKTIPKSNVNKYVVNSKYDGKVTGTIYLGSRKSEVYAKVYDKRDELISKRGYDVGHPLTRYELTATSKVGVSLKDASEPQPLFWNYMSSILPMPPDIAPWVPGGTGYQMPERKKLMPAEHLKKVVSESPEIERWLKYADEAGPNGREYLLGLLRRRIIDKQSNIETSQDGNELEKRD